MNAFGNYLNKSLISPLDGRGACYTGSGFFVMITFRNIGGDSGDRVTAETDIENDPSSAVNADDPDNKTEENSADVSSESECSVPPENVSGDSSDAPVTADSRCENSCQPVTLP